METQQMNWSALKDEAVSFVKTAATRIVDVERESLHIDTKEDADDLVTDKDIEIQRLMTDQIRKFYPTHRIVGEEGDHDDVHNDDTITWIIDPIDGTTNFVHQSMNYCVSVGIYQRGIGYVGIVYDVKSEEWFTAVRGLGAYMNGKRLPKRASVPFEQAILGFNARWLVGKADESLKQGFQTIVRDVRAVRSYGSAALESAYVAAGRLDGYMSLRLSPWDFAAAKVLLEETGCECVKVDGSPISIEDQSTYLAAVPNVSQEFLSRLQ
ncbi:MULTISPECIES: inositol monophosphatase family protein [Geomicrobium]|uniref:Myo-inositol-1(Or 4)-monophosphatase n=2 Tax=Geomicrobium TaxID=767528 RepID=A0ABS2PI06_9BACL|nr:MULTISPECIES: inositol monophosphatase family protein [Geomicrobium]MBM7635062.1 myo-inositol-1(or 4)-monophosphatase [Geomicrobium sediminis]GAK07375.1 inositol-1-monophosphatase [Geomicrobium sp. JCM 19038]